MLRNLAIFDLSDTLMGGIVPESIGQLIYLEELYLGYKTDSNTFVGPLPSSMSNLVGLTDIYLNVATLRGPLPDFGRLTSLDTCRFTPSHICLNPNSVPVNSNCDFSVLPDCQTETDCHILAEWLPEMFYSYTCCQVDGVTCEEDHIIILDLSSAKTKKKIEGAIPSSIGELSLLQQLYLQDNYLEGNLPESLANIDSLQLVDISNNLLYGVLIFIPSFKLIGVDSNFDLSLPVPTQVPDARPEITNNEPGSKSVALIAGLALFGLIILLFVGAVVILLKRRKQGKESPIELQLLPKYSSASKQIRLMRMINSGGFGVVWKARYKGETVAIKLIRMDKNKEKGAENTLRLEMIKMVVDEQSIMELMVHERIVRFIKFEIESLGIVLEYLPLGSLYGYIQKSKGNYPWTDRYQMMLDICEGMEFLHSKVYADGSQKKVLFHQDLKSGNVLLAMEGSPPTLRGKISDFGLSCKIITTLIILSSLER
jgi:hypothetical protein